MKQKNLWIAALALGITLSAHGQQSGGGISPTMLQQIKQSYHCLLYTSPSPRDM